MNSTWRWCRSRVVVAAAAVLPPPPKEATARGKGSEVAAAENKTRRWGTWKRDGDNSMNKGAEFWGDGEQLTLADGDGGL